MEEERQEQPEGQEEIRELISWDFPERPEYRRGPFWHAAMVVAGLGLLIYSVKSGNFLFALLILMFGLVIYVTAAARPARLRFAVYEDGIQVGRDFYRFREVERFWFFYEPPVRTLYLNLKGIGMGSRVRVDLMDTDPNEVRTVLAQFVREDLRETEEPASDTIGRLLKI